MLEDIEDNLVNAGTHLPKLIRLFWNGVQAQHNDTARPTSCPNLGNNSKKKIHNENMDPWCLTITCVNWGPASASSTAKSPQISGPVARVSSKRGVTRRLSNLGITSQKECQLGAVISGKIIITLLHKGRLCDPQKFSKYQKPVTCYNI